MLGLRVCRHATIRHLDLCIAARARSSSRAQHAGARQYGLGSWAELNRHLEANVVINGADNFPGRRYLADAVDVIHRLVENEEHAGRCHLVHVLFAMRAAGWSIDCETLMCVTGTAFSFWYQHDNRHVAYSLPRDWEERIAEATGFGYEDLKHDGVEDAWRHIVESVDIGRLVNAEWMEGVTFAGYDETEAGDGRRVFAIDKIFEWPGAWWDWAKFVKWYEEWCKPFRWLARHSERVAAPTSGQSAAAVLSRIPDWANEQPPGDLPNAHFGLDGILAYAGDIADTSKGEDYLHSPWRACHAIQHQWQVRRLPGVYLRRAARDFEGGTRKHVLTAAEGYEAAYAAWQEWNNQLGKGACDQSKGRDAVRQEVADAWESPQRRAAGAAAVRKAYEHEKAAVNEIKQALASPES